MASRGMSKAKPIPAKVLQGFFGAADVFQTPQSLLNALLGRCTADSLDAKQALHLIARDCCKLRLSDGRRVVYAQDFAEFFNEMANRLEAA